jgi:hypothetical protein
MQDPGLRREIRDFAIAAANNSKDGAAISGRLDSRYRYVTPLAGQEGHDAAPPEGKLRSSRGLQRERGAIILP